MIGQPIRIDDLRERTAGLPKGEAHKVATVVMEDDVRDLAGLPPSTPNPPRSTSRPATSSPAPGGGSGGGAPTPFAAKAPGGSG